MAPKRIMCVGMCVLDIIHICEHFPKEDSDKRCLDGYWQRGGNASNSCTVLRQLGADCEFLGMLSESPAFGFLLDDCRNRGIVIENCPTAAQDPPFSSVILVKTSDTRTIIHSNPGFPILLYTHFKDRVNLDNYSWIHFEARNPDETILMLNDIHHYNERALRRGEDTITISVEMEKVRTENLQLASKADLVFLGKDLAQNLGWSNGCDAVHGLRKLLKEMNEAKDSSGKAQLPDIVCPWGSRGSDCLDKCDVYAHLPANPPETIVDSLGAGDTFCAATIYAINHLKVNLQEAIRFANRCAGFKLGHRGYDAIKDFHQNIE